MAFDPSNPNKYKNQAHEYNSCIQELNNELGAALSELNKVNDTLGITSSGEGDSSLNKDALTLNVIVSNEEIKEEIKNLQEEVSGYSSLITPKAAELDELEKAEYEAEQARLRALKSQNENNNTNNEIIETLE